MSSKPPQTKPLGSIGSIHDSGVSSITKPQIPILLRFNSGRLLITMRLPLMALQSLQAGIMLFQFLGETSCFLTWTSMATSFRSISLPSQAACALPGTLNAWICCPVTGIHWHHLQTCSRMGKSKSMRE